MEFIGEHEMDNNIKKTIASANINFLIGAGLSTPFLGVLGDIEKRLAEETDIDKITQIKKEYFEVSISGNVKLIAPSVSDVANIVLNCYERFYKTINQIVLKRESTLLSKQINMFTTNIDIFSEMALERTGIEFNDGFHGRFRPKYDVGNFKKSYYKTSLHYENTTEIPVFNIIKLHGSVSWEKDNDKILLDRKLDIIKNIQDNFDDFKKLMIINPEEKKFEDITLNQIYYDLLRVYTNELERENSVLFVLGFSFADKHIRDLTIRVANSNPTLKIYIFSHVKEMADEYEEMKNVKNNNIEIIFPLNYGKNNFSEIIDIFDKCLNDTIIEKNE